MRRRDKRRRIILNDDAARVYGQDLSPEEFGKLAIQPLLGKQVDTVVWSLMDATVFPTRMEDPKDMVGGDPSRPLEEILAELPEVARDWALRYIPQCRRLWAEDTDGLAVVVREGHKHGLEVLADIRMNDNHYVGSQALDIEWCPFSREHPEFTLRGGRSTLDYAHPEVRAWRLNHLRQIANNWDVDGIELDFYRAPEFFKAPAAEKAPLMTEFMEQLQAILDEAGKRRGRPVLLAVRTMPNFETSLSIGLDVREWLERGWIDLLIPGGGYMTMDVPFEEMLQVAHANDCQVYPCISYPRAEAYTWAWAANSYAKGADGLYLFNIFPPRTEHPMYNEIGDPANLPGKSKLFDAQHRYLNLPWQGDHLAWPPSLPLPRDVHQGFARIPILVSDDFGASTGQAPVASLRLSILGLEENHIRASVNGHKLTDTNVPKGTPTQGLLAEWEVPATEKRLWHMSKTLAPTHEYVVPVDWLVSGVNQVKVSVSADTIAAVQVLLDYSAPQS